MTVRFQVLFEGDHDFGIARSPRLGRTAVQSVSERAFNSQTKRYGFRPLTGASSALFGRFGHKQHFTFPLPTRKMQLMNFNMA